MSRPAPLRFVCVRDEHLRIGVSVPDEHGHLTMHQGKWAYCSAARPKEPHAWKEIPPTHLFALGHAGLLRFGTKLAPSSATIDPTG